MVEMQCNKTMKAFGIYTHYSMQQPLYLLTFNS
jgi:hypothetical protein